MSDRRLIVGEFDTTDPDAGKLFGLPPNNATGIAVPAFKYGPVRPPVGVVVGEAFIETSTGVASVWDGNTWTQIAVPVIVPHDTENHLIASTPNDGTVAYAEDTANLYVRTQGDWRALGIRIYPDRTALNADTPPDGTMGFSAATGEYLLRAGGVWAALAQQTVTVAATAPGNVAAGEQWFDTANSTLWTYDGTTWQPPTGGLPTGTIITFAKWDPPIGYLRCDGDPIPAGTQYDALRALLGQANTPDLRNQFIRMAQQDTQCDSYSLHNDTTRRPRNDFRVHATGTTSSGGSHSHTKRFNSANTDGNWDYADNVFLLDDSRNPQGYHSNIRTSTAGSHIHNVSIDGTVHGGGDAETAPAHVRLAYHIKAF